MALIDRFAPTDIPDRLPAHGFSTMIAVGNNGTLGNAVAARARIISEFNLQLSDEPQLDLIIAAIQSAVGTEEKYKIIRDLEDSLVAYESGLITKAEAISNINIV